MGKWEMVRLGDAATFINGFAFKPSDWTKEGLPIIRIQNLTSSSDVINYYSKPYSLRYEVNNGDILISWSASLGVYEWNSGKALLNQHIFKVVFDKLDYDKRFFMYLISQKIDEMFALTHGSTMKHITKKHFDAIIIPLPPLDVQQKIADVLDHATALIEKRKAQIEKLDLLVKSKFIEMFGDEKRAARFEEITTVLQRGKSPKYADNSEIGVINQACIYWEGMTFEKIKYHTRNYDKARELVKDDVLINSTGTGTLGRIAIFEPIGSFEAFVADSHVTVARLKKSIVTPEYLRSYLQQPKAQDTIYRECVSGSTNQIELSKTALLKLKIPLPGFERQMNYSSFVKQVDKSKFAIHKSLEELETLKQALMQQYFG